MNCKLKEAIELATEAHKGQLDKGGIDYILHPLHVMNQMETEEERIVAILHDTVEDTKIQLKDIYVKFGYRVGEAIKHMTKTKGEEYNRYIGNLSKNELAVRVKIKDLEHNLDETRPHKLSKSLKSRYNKAREFLIYGITYE